MKLREIEQFHSKNNVLPNQSSTLRRIKSLNELTPTEEYYFRRIILIICFINTILGYYILSNSSFYIIQEFYYKKELKCFIMIYTLNLLLTFIISFLISLTIYFIYSVFIKKKSKEKLPIDEVSLIPYTFTIFIILDIILYFSALPCSLFFLWKIIKNDEYSNYKKYLLLYIFIGINLIIGLILLYTLIVMIIKNATHSDKQIKFDFDESKLSKIKDEVTVAMKKANKNKKKKLE